MLISQYPRYYHSLVSLREDTGQLNNRYVTQDEFSRAVNICTGKHLSSHMVDTVFQIFDDDGDGLLSYQEFVAMMKDRIHRGLKSYSRQEGWQGFKNCIRREIKEAA